MKVGRKHLYAAGGGVVAAVLAYFFFRDSTAEAATTSIPVVLGQVTSGQKSLTIDDNVMSPTFGLPVY